MSHGEFLEDLNTAIMRHGQETNDEVVGPALIPDYDDSQQRENIKFTTIVPDIAQVIRKIQQVPLSEYSGLAKLYGQLFRLKTHYQTLSDTFGNSRILHQMDNVMKEFEQISEEIGKYLNKLSSDVRQRVLRSADGSEIEFISESGEELKKLWNQVSHTRLLLESFENGTKQTQHDQRMAEQENNNDDQTEIARALQLIESKEVTITDLRNTIDIKTAEFNRTNAELQEEKNRNKEAQNTIQSQMAQIRDLKQQVATLRQNLTTTEQARDSLQTQLATEKQQVATLRQNLTDMKTARDSLQTQLTAEKQQVATLRQNLTTTEQARDNFQRGIRLLTAELQQMTAQRDASLASQAEKENLNTRLTNDLSNERKDKE
jgi:chromosome segregation ATPase